MPPAKPATPPEGEQPEEEKPSRWKRKARATFTPSDPEVLHQIQELAKENLRPLSAEIELAIRNWLKMQRKGKDQKP